MSRGSGRRKWQPNRRAQSILWLTALAVKPHFASRRAGKILIVCSDCAQVLPVKGAVIGVYDHGGQRDRNARAQGRFQRVVTAEQARLPDQTAQPGSRCYGLIVNVLAFDVLPPLVVPPLLGEALVVIVTALVVYCSMSVWAVGVLLTAPTAQQSDADTQVTPWRKEPLSGEGEVTIDHEVPFHCSISTPLMSMPTAQQSDAEAHATALRWSTLLVLGEVTIDHEVPSQCSISVSRLPVLGA
jgi:hypothetical protein